jgi:hypothetical protein
MAALSARRQSGAQELEPKVVAVMDRGTQTPLDPLILALARAADRAVVPRGHHSDQAG